jgi:hypothetical protein
MEIGSCAPVKFGWKERLTAMMRICSLEMVFGEK